MLCTQDYRLGMVACRWNDGESGCTCMLRLVLPRLNTYRYSSDMSKVSNYSVYDHFVDSFNDQVYLGLI